MVAPYMVRPTTEAVHALGEFATATIRIADYDHSDGSPSAAMMKVSTLSSDELTAELEGATEWLALPADEILLAALARTIARTLGEGVVPVDVASERGSLLDGVPLVCAVPAQASATEVLAGVNRTLATASEHPASGPSEVYFNYIGEVPEETVPVQETPPALGHALEVRVYQASGHVHIDWWYDTSRFESYTITELSEQFPLALFEMTSDALPPV